MLHVIFAAVLVIEGIQFIRRREYHRERKRLEKSLRETSSVQRGTAGKLDLSREARLEAIQLAD